MILRRVRGEAPAKRLSDLSTRALAGAAMIALALACLAAGGTPFWLLCALCAMLMLAEWAGLMRCTFGRINLALIAMIVPLAAAAPFLMGSDRDTVALLIAAALAVVVAAGSMRLGLGLVYAGLPVIGLLFLRTQPNGFILTLWTLSLVWATDIGAYFSGRAIGGPKLAPRLSPNKTWAGLFGGMSAALVIGGTVALVGGLPWGLIVAAPLLAVLAQIGDLFESWLKRRAGVKDSGRFLPGHGGALDRLDGVVPVAIAVSGLAAGGLL